MREPTIYLAIPSSPMLDRVSVRGRDLITGILDDSRRPFVVDEIPIAGARQPEILT